jgi:hypothetical protein
MHYTNIFGQIQYPICISLSKKVMAGSGSAMMTPGPLPQPCLLPAAIVIKQARSGRSGLVSAHLNAGLISAGL